jgi:transcriptional regulator with XRE-family HTH domain
MDDPKTERTGTPTEDPISRRLLEILRRARRERGMSIYDLAARIGKTPSFVSLLENGKQVPDVETVTRIAKALRLDQRLLRAWVEVRRSRDATRAVDAARELMELLDLEGSPLVGSSRALQSPMVSDEPAGFGAGEDHLMAAMSAAPPMEEIRGDQVRIPVVAAGTEPGHPDEQRGHPRRPLWLDHRLLPPVEELREPFAFRVGRESGRRVRDLLSRGDYAVVSRDGARRPALSTREVYAVRLAGMVVLSRVDYKEGKLLLLPAREGSGIDMLDAPTPAALSELIAGRLVAVLRAFRREEGETPGRLRRPAPRAAR